MKKFLFSCLLLCGVAGSVSSQNDLDVVRYSRGGNGGSARFTAMGGGMGALGGDLGVAAYNPAGLAIYRKRDFNFGFGLRVSTNQGKAFGSEYTQSAAKFLFSNFGIVGVWPDKNDPDSRHALAFSNIQSQNFSNSVRYQGYTNKFSIARDMLNQASGKTLSGLNNSYEGLGFDTYLIDYDSVAGKYFSFLDVNRTVKQSREISTTGRVNDLNVSYAYTYKDQLYFGLSVGFPQLNYSSTTTHTEEDDKDSMRVIMGSGSSYTTTYTEDLPQIYASKLGFNSLTYEEYFKTSGSGLNLKIGGIYRVNDYLRVGGYVHTPTYFNLTDTYQNSMSVSFDKDKLNPATESYPDGAGVYTYRLVTPARLSGNIGIVIKKIAAIGIDYETVNYRNGRLKGSNSSDFVSANSTIQRKYTMGQNLRVGGELNLNALKLRAGYAMYGSPFGDIFVGDFVRNTFSAGLGIKSSGSFYMDLVYALSFVSEVYYPFNSLDVMTRLKYRSGTLSMTAGFRF